MKTSNLLAINT